MKYLFSVLVLNDNVNRRQLAFFFLRELLCKAIAGFVLEKELADTVTFSEVSRSLVQKLWCLKLRRCFT